MRATTPAHLAPFIIHLYPHPWRARYGAEALDLLALRPATWGDVWNLACHLVYHWLHPDAIAEGERPASGARLALFATIWRALGHVARPRQAE